MYTIFDLSTNGGKYGKKVQTRPGSLSPGAPGGSIMTALPFLPMVGIASDGAIASLLIALYIMQDSFGTACNVSGDNAISVMIETIYQKYIKNKNPIGESVQKAAN
jgi:Na+/H+-dicarboxylate symporter